MTDIRTAMAMFAALAVSNLLAGEIEIAREALRDGLWEVARSHAAAAGGEESKEIVAESLAREGKWRELLEAYGDDGEGKSDALDYYMALALHKTGQDKRALAMLGKMDKAEEPYRSLASVLDAVISLGKEGGQDAPKALKLVKEIDFDAAGDEARMIAAGIMDANGERKDAEKIWHSIISSTNADEKAFVIAAVNLGDADALRKARGSATDANLRRMATLQLGVKLIADAATFEEGAAMIAGAAGESPDTRGAKEAMLSLASAYLSAGDDAAAAEKYRQILETWPDAAFMGEVHEANGWALRNLGRRAEAIESFRRAGEAATNDTAKASAALAQGDTLSEMGRGDEAMVLFREVLEKYPATEAGKKLKGMVKHREMEADGISLYDEYRFEDARKTFASLAAEEPELKPRMDYFDMLCLYGLGRDEEALAKAKEIAEGSGDNILRAEATLWMAKYAYNRRRWGEAQKLFAAYAKMVPGSASAPSALVWSAKAAFAENDFPLAIETATRLVREYPDSAEKPKGYLVQGESLIELARFDEAILAIERVIVSDATSASDRMHAQLVKADALFAMGADNPRRYGDALEAYGAIRRGEALGPGERLMVSYKYARTLEKLKRTDEAVDNYYTDVVLAYRDGRRKGVWYDDEARAAFARAAFRLADEYEARGKDFQAMHILELVVASDVPAATEAEKRIDRIQTKGRML